MKTNIVTRELDLEEIEAVSGAAPREQGTGGTGPYDPTGEMKEMTENDSL